MIYDLYYHNDFDGRAAAAIMLAFLRSRGDDVEHFAALGYEMADQYTKENFFAEHKFFKGKRNPAIVVDFAFHPKAAWWFDHHPTTFKKESWRRKFKSTKYWHYEPKYESCCAEVAAVLKNDFGWEGPAHFKELIRWGDYLDGAHYRSVREVMELRSLGTQIDAFVDRYATDPKRTGKPFIEMLAAKPLREIVRLPAIQHTVTQVLKNRKAALGYYRKHMLVAGRVGYVDLSRKDFEKMRFAGYYFHPSLLYMVRILKKGGLFQISVGQNPWRRKESRVNIGDLMKKYGGGGHQGVGATETKTKKAAEKVAKEIVAYLETKSN
jgi:hypothetical protein